MRGVFSGAATDAIYASQDALDEIWSQNASIPEQIQGCVHDLIAGIAESQSDTLAVCAWDGDFTYGQLEALASEVARRLIGLVAPKSSIPILFSKSRWTPVAMLGIIKAGCACIALDPSQPDTRLRSIAQQAHTRTIVSSATHRMRASLLVDVPVLQVDDVLLNVLDLPKQSSPQLPVVSPSDIVYISFTSGTSTYLPS